MKISSKLFRNTLIALATLLPGVALAAPISYDITDGSSSGFSASWLHSANSSHSAGFYMNGNKASISGNIVIDWSTGAASGSIATDAADTDFGSGSGSWVMNITGGTTTDSRTFNNGDSLLLALDYVLSNGSSSSTGTFYFADTTFAGAANSATASQIYLWGNNWFNENGSSDRTAFVGAGGIALGIDLYGEGTPVPEPSVLLLLGMGLTGLGFYRKRKAA